MRGRGDTGMQLDFKETAKEIHHFIDNKTLFDCFDVEDVKKIIENATVDINHYISMLELGRETLNIVDLFDVTKKTKIEPQYTTDDIINLISAIRKNLHFNILRVVIDHIDELENQIEYEITRKEKAAEQAKNIRKEADKLSNMIQERDQMLQSIQSQIMNQSHQEQTIATLRQTINEQIQEIKNLKKSLEQAKAKLDKSGNDSTGIELVQLADVITQEVEIAVLQGKIKNKPMVKFDYTKDCAFTITNKAFVPCNFYICNDCCGKNQCICEACARKCHRGHRLSEVIHYKGAYCDCGSGELRCKCQCMDRDNFIIKDMDSVLQACLSINQ